MTFQGPVARRERKGEKKRRNKWPSRHQKSVAAARSSRSEKGEVEGIRWITEGGKKTRKMDGTDD